MALVLCAANTSVTAQNNTILRKHMWLVGTVAVERGDWTFKTSLEERSFVLPLRQTEFHGPKLQAALDIGQGFSVIAGGRYAVHSKPFDPNEEVSISIPEWRIHAGVVYKTTIGSVSWKNQFKAEQRFYRKDNNGVFVDGHSRVTRLRLKTTFKVPLVDAVNFQIGNEFLVNVEGTVAKDFVDQNRAAAGFAFDMGEHASLALLYLSLYKDGGGPQYSPIHHVLSLHFSYTIPKAEH
jgi:hypothetical protein